jgi:hypothetical protein
MTRTLGRAWHRRRTAFLLATATIAASFGWALAPGPSSSAQTPDPPFTVEVSQTSGLLDGDVVDVTVRADPGARIEPDAQNDLFICRPGLAYTTAADLAASAGNCPFFASVSTSSEGSARLFTLADGSRAEGDIAVGVGIAEWSPGFGLPNATLECGPAAPCLLVVRVATSVAGAPATDNFATFELTFTTPDPTAGCGSRNPAAISTAGSDRMQAMWARSTLAQCTSGASLGASTSFAPTGEGEGLAAFAVGGRDLVYTAAGYRPIGGLDPSPQRSPVYTPVALNAVVIAAMGGQLVNDDPQWPVGLPKPYAEPIRMTAAEAATLVGQGLSFFSVLSGPEFLARNPHIGPEAHYRSDSDKLTGTVAVQDATAVSLFATSFLDTRAPDQWIQRPSLEDRGVHAQLGNADPDFAISLSPVSQKSQMAALRNALGQNAANTGPAWVLTDYATAIELGLTPVAIQNAAGEYVLPTPQSIAAGVATMTVDADGRRAPDPGASAPGAYPLTMIEYAMAPSEPLVDEACAPRAESQQLLSSWLTFLTGPAQAGLGVGFVPLTSELTAEAEQAIARVGTSPSTAVCAPVNPGGPGGPGTTGPLAAGVGSSGGTGTGGSGTGTRGSGSGAGADAAAGALSPSTPDELAGASELADAAEPTLPPFLGIAAVSELISPVALLLVVVLTSGAAFLTSGRPVPPAIARAGTKVASAADGLARKLPGVRRG